MGVKKYVPTGRKKRKKYKKQTLSLELLIEKNKWEILNNEHQMEEIYMKIDEKHAGTR
ncbi:FbpB family small basic protein [Bacillus atrophaeus]|uniref:FbpB family small basic protein n=1 Tax=Bacillus atrophaeus TaxID=1452 RepID=UPI002282B505|nr:FbpB family small basic protein [Bacillus atrophaeus]MCY8486529.1 FbpB family small basic protein [Bacillus atrophaeus]